MKIRVRSAYATRLKVLIFADLMNYRHIIVENTQAQYFDNLTRTSTRVVSTMTLPSCINFANINALFLLHTLSLSFFVCFVSKREQLQCNCLYEPLSKKKL